MRNKIYLLLLMVLFLQDLFGQCSMCKAVAEDQAEEGPSGINTGIIFMMIMPYVLLFFLFRKKIFGFLRELKNAKHKVIKE